MLDDSGLGSAFGFDYGTHTTSSQGSNQLVLSQLSQSQLVRNESFVRKQNVLDIETVAMANRWFDQALTDKRALNSELVVNFTDHVMKINPDDPKDGDINKLGIVKFIDSDSMQWMLSFERMQQTQLNTILLQQNEFLKAHKQLISFYFIAWIENFYDESKKTIVAPTKNSLRKILNLFGAILTYQTPAPSTMPHKRGKLLHMVTSRNFIFII